jgi:hypothetical protein
VSERDFQTLFRAFKASDIQVQERLQAHGSSSTGRRGHSNAAAQSPPGYALDVDRVYAASLNVCIYATRPLHDFIINKGFLNRIIATMVRKEQRHRYQHGTLFSTNSAISPHQ